MPLPENWDLVPVRGRFVGTNGQALTGRVIFTPKASRLVSIAALTTLIGRAVSAQLDENGSFEVYLPATNDPDITPTGFSYTVKEDFTGGSTYDITVPISAVADGIELAAVAPTSPNSGSSLGPVTRLEYEAFKAAFDPDNLAAAVTAVADAQAAATSASGSASTATTKASQASTSASNASTSASNAAGSATAAATSASNAATAKSAAETARDAAIAAKTAAEAVPTSNDTIIAGRINDSASATAAALTASTARQIAVGPGTASISGGAIHLSVTSPWGIRADGSAYYTDDPAGARSGEAAVLSIDPTTGTPRLTLIGA